MKIKIETAKADQIQAALDEVNGKASAFTLQYFYEVAGYAEEVERNLEKSGLPKDERAGVVAEFTPAGPTTRAYKYAAKSTTIQIERGSSAWYLTKVLGTVVHPKQSARRTIRITPEQRDTIQRKAIEGYLVTTPAASE